MLQHFYGDITEYKRLISIVLSESHRFRYKRGLGVKLSENEIHHITSSSLLKLLDQAHKKEVKGEVIDDVAAYYAKSYEHELYNYLKERNKDLKKTIYLGDFPGFVIEAELDDTGLMNETFTKVNEDIKMLNEKERLIIKMQFSDTMSQKEIAELLGISPDSVKTTLFRAMQKLRKLFNAKRNTK